jgi:hypothetical protein
MAQKESLKTPLIEKRENLSITIKHLTNTEESAKNPLVQIASVASDDTQMRWMVKRAAFLYLVTFYDIDMKTDYKENVTTMTFRDVTEIYPIDGPYTLKEILMDMIFKGMDNVEMSVETYMSRMSYIYRSKFDELIIRDEPSGSFFPLSEVNKPLMSYLRFRDFGHDIEKDWKGGIERECLKLAYRFLQDYHMREDSRADSLLRMGSHDYSYYLKMRILIYIGFKAVEVYGVLKKPLYKGIHFEGWDYENISDFYKSDTYEFEELEYAANEFLSCLNRNPRILESFIPKDENEEMVLKSFYKNSYILIDPCALPITIIDGTLPNKVVLLGIAERYLCDYIFRYSAYGTAVVKELMFKLLMFSRNHDDEEED